MPLLTDEQAEAIRRDFESGLRGNLLVKWINQLLDDREERVQLDRQAEQPDHTDK